MTNTNLGELTLPRKLPNRANLSNWADMTQQTLTIWDSNKTLEPIKAIGRNIVSRREEIGFSQEDLAALIGTNRRRIQTIEEGEVRTSPILIRVLAQALEIPLEKLLPELQQVSLDPDRKDVMVFRETEEITTSLFYDRDLRFFYAAMGRNIGYYRELRGISIRELAQAITNTDNDWVARGYIKRIEAGEAKPDIFLILLICRKIEIKLDFIFPRFNIDKNEGLVRTMNFADLAAIAAFITKNKQGELYQAIAQRMCLDKSNLNLNPEEKAWLTRAEFYSS